VSDRAGDLMEQRYGTPRPGRRPLVVAVAALLAAAGIGWIVWTAAFHGSPSVQSQLISFVADTEHSATATFTVARSSDDVEASCLLRATAADHSVVGELTFEVGPSAPVTATFERSLRTERKASSVDLVGCVADGQSRQR
jgi:hypothetical protein